MEIQQYIYGRLTSEQSPRQMAGFQSAFVPQQFLSPQEISLLESRIHFPTHSGFTEKTAVFYQQVAGKAYLILLFLKSLPEERDAFGRTGAFLCQGFILPPELWHQHANPLVFANWLQAHRFADTATAVSAHTVDREKGNIAPLNLPVPDSFPNGPEAFAKLTQVLQALEKPEHKGLNLILKGTPVDVSAALAASSAQLPTILRTKLGWDPAFDGGRMHSSPFRIFGYSQLQPTMGRMVEFNLTNQTIINAPPKFP